MTRAATTTAWQARGRKPRARAVEGNRAGTQAHGGAARGAARRDPCRRARGVHRARFEGARLDDVARRAGVAKGTIYLYFADKETLFQELVRSMVNPVLGTLQAMSARSTSRHACWSSG